MVRTRNQEYRDRINKLQVDPPAEETKCKIKGCKITGFEEPDKSLDFGDDTKFLDNLRKDLEKKKTKLHSELNPYIQQENWIKSVYPDDKEMIDDYNKEVSTLLNDFEFMRASLDGGKIKILVEGNPDIAPMNQKEVVWVATDTLNDQTVILKKEAVSPALPNDAVLNLPVVHTYTQWNVHDAWPGWERVWKIFYKVYGETNSNYAISEAAFWSPCSMLDSLWVKVEPTKFRGVIACIPSPLDVIGMKWEYHRVSLIFSVLLFFMIVAYLIWRFTKFATKTVPNEIMRVMRGRPKTKDKED